MIYLVAAASVLVVALGTTAARLRHRPTTFALRQPTPFVFAHIRVLRNDREVREVAHHAYAREQRIADAAQRRAARLQ